MVVVVVQPPKERPGKELLGCYLSVLCLIIMECVLSVLFLDKVYLLPVCCLPYL